MDTVTFLAVKGQEKVSPGTEEVRIQDGLMEDMEDGLLFERMVGWNVEEAWRVIDTDLAWIEERKQYRKADWGTNSKRYRKWMALMVQRELNILCKELSKTKAGKKVLESLRECYTDQSAELGPLRGEVARKDILPEAKKAAEQELREKHLVLRKRFQECFSKATGLKIQIGQRVVDFYFGELRAEKVSSMHTA